MKKYLFMALAAFAFVSCSNDFDANEGAATTENGKRIEYDVYAGAASRGSIIADLEALQEGGHGYHVWANIINANVDTTTYLNRDNVYVSDAWVTGADIWPVQPLAFYFYAPETALTLDNDQHRKAEYRYSQPEAPGNQKDILYGTPVTGKTSGTGAVNVALTHVMSHITFKAKAGPNVPGAGLVISSIALKGQFATAGTMDFKAANSATFWKDTVMQDTVYRPGTVSSSVSNKVDYTNVLQTGDSPQDLFIIPCTVPALTIEVNYTASGRNWTKSFTVNNQEFAIGQSYEIRLTLDVDLITYTISNETFGSWGTATEVTP